MYKISHIHELSQVSGVPPEVMEVAKNIVTILDREYGAKRDPLYDDGGYVVILSPNDEVDVLDGIGINVKSLCSEQT